MTGQELKRQKYLILFIKTEMYFVKFHPKYRILYHHDNKAPTFTLNANAPF